VTEDSLIVEYWGGMTFKLEKARGGVSRVKVNSVYALVVSTHLMSEYSRIWSDGNGMVHRDGGPALECENGVKEWYQHGRRVSAPWLG